MDLKKTIQLVIQLQLLWEEMDELDPGEETTIPAITLKVGKERWEVGPIAAKRIK